MNDFASPEQSNVYALSWALLRCVMYNHGHFPGTLASSGTDSRARGVVDLGGEGAVAIVEQHADRVVAPVRDSEVRVAIAIQIRRGDRGRTSTGLLHRRVR